MPVALFVALTEAPGTTAPEGSVTVPLIAPRYVCAVAGKTTENTNNTIAKNFFIPVPHKSSFYRWTDRCCPGSRFGEMEVCRRFCRKAISISEFFRNRSSRNRCHTRPNRPGFSRLFGEEECNTTGNTAEVLRMLRLTRRQVKVKQRIA